MLSRTSNFNLDRENQEHLSLFLEVIEPIDGKKADRSLRAGEFLMLDMYRRSVGRDPSVRNNAPTGLGRDANLSE
jgi:hypothetical protein